MDPKENSKSVQKEYLKDNLKIIWRPDLCAHAGVCVRTLPDVYHPKESPWVRPENATIEELIGQIENCPSGALSYELIDLKEMI